MNKEDGMQGVWAAVLTPMKENLKIDHKELASHCKEVINKGCQGIVLFGSTGEGPSFSIDERIEAVKAVIQLGIDSSKIIVCICSCSIDDVVHLAKVSLALQCSSVLIAPPFYYKNVTDEGVIAFFREIIHAVNNPALRILLYHIPQNCAIPITMNAIKTLTKEFQDIVIGIKESEGDISFTKKILEEVPGFLVFVANDTLISEAVRLGAYGAITGFANVYPHLICSLYQHGLEQTTLDRNEEIKRIHQALSPHPKIAALKAILAKRKGTVWNMLRPPLIPLKEDQKKSLSEALIQHRLEEID
jgi:4-hydroxy-tetrahydrodipicolinate synthase